MTGEFEGLVGVPTGHFFNDSEGGLSPILVYTSPDRVDEMLAEAEANSRQPQLTSFVGFRHDPDAVVTARKLNEALGKAGINDDPAADEGAVKEAGVTETASGLTAPRVPRRPAEPTDAATVGHERGGLAAGPGF